LATHEILLINRYGPDFCEFNPYFEYFMAKVIIIGGGFAGVEAARRLRKFNASIDITLIDKKRSSDFLPLLPDCIGRGIDSTFL
jgi:hypothetical protein